MTTAQTSEFDQYQGKKVILTVADATEENPGQTKEIEGTATAANALGIMLKPKGKTGLELYEADTIQSVAYAPEKEKELKAKTLKVVEYGNAKQHLVDRHGYKLSEINKMSEQEAFDFHNDLDHVELELGHVHGEKESAASGGAEAAAESDAENPSE
jgi:hypothetical protein